MIVSNYSIKYTSASITFTTDSYSTKGITCTPTPEMDVTYNLLYLLLSSLSCLVK